MKLKTKLTSFFIVVLSALNAQSSELPEYQTKYICKGIDQARGNELQFILSYESIILIESLKITKLDGKSVDLRPSDNLLSERYISPTTINFRYAKNETTETFIALESVEKSVVAPEIDPTKERVISKFNARIRILSDKDQDTFEYACKEEALWEDQ